MYLDGGPEMHVFMDALNIINRPFMLSRACVNNIC